MDKLDELENEKSINFVLDYTDIETAKEEIKSIANSCKNIYLELLNLDEEIANRSKPLTLSLRKLQNIRVELGTLNTKTELLLITLEIKKLSDKSMMNDEELSSMIIEMRKSLEKIQYLFYILNKISDDVSKNYKV